MAKLTNKSFKDQTSTAVTLTFDSDTAMGRVYRATNTVAPLATAEAIVTAADEDIAAVAGPMEFVVAGLTAGVTYYHDVVQDTQEAPTGSNLFPDSEDFSQWGSANAALTPGQGDPFASTGATLLSGDGTEGSAAININDVLTLSAGLRYCFSVYGKAGAAPGINLNTSEFSVGANGNSSFSLATGALLRTPSTQHTDHGFTDMGNGFFRVWVSILMGEDAVGKFKIIPTDGAGLPWTPKIGTDITIFGAQLNAGSSPDAYTATTGSPVP